MRTSLALKKASNWLDFRNWRDRVFAVTTLTTQINSQVQPMFGNSLLVFALIVLSAGADSMGFIHAAKIWQQDAISWLNVCCALSAWSIGVMLYVVSLRYLTRLGVTSAEVHTIVWFAMTIIGVIVLSGKFFSWPRLEQGVATVLLMGLGWLLVRTAE